MSLRDIIMLFLCIAYVAYSLYSTIRFLKTDKFYSKRQKIIHVILIWALPVLWSFLLKKANEPVPGTKYYRDYKRDHPFEDDGTSPFYESKKGFYK